MASLFITYYKKIGTDKLGTKIPIGEEPNQGGEEITFTANAESNTFPKQVAYVRLIADADAHIAFGLTGLSAGSSSTIRSSLKLEANQAEYFALNPRENRKGTLLLAVYDGST